MNNKYLIYGLAEYVTSLKYEDLTKRAIEVAKQCILDSYGNMIFGRYSEASIKIMKYMHMSDMRISNEKPVSVIGTDFQETGIDNAVFGHTMMARCADLDDGYRHAMGHPGSGLVPLLLAVAELNKNNGKEMITALTAAYDVYARLGEALNPFMYREKGFDATGVCGAVASAALISKLMSLSTEKTKNAMGIASLFTGGLIEYQNDGTSGKIMCSGWGALTGLRAVRLSLCGFTGPNAALEGRYGFFQAFMGNSGHLNIDNVLTNLKKDFKITSIYFKRHACQRGLHAMLDSVLELREKFSLTCDRIKKVDVRTSSFLERLSNPIPSTAVGAQASAQFTSAIVLKYGRLDSESLVFKSFTDPEILALVKKISISKDEKIEAYLNEHPTHFCAANVIIETLDGEKIEKWRAVPLGDPETPFGWDMLKTKFNHLIAGTPFENSKEKSFEFIINLETKEDIKELFGQ
jgi:2-methylcitrate dehydratase PrpD